MGNSVQSLSGIETDLTAILDRVARRKSAETATPGDHKINQSLYEGLGDAVRITQGYLPSKSGSISAVNAFTAARLSSASSAIVSVLDEMDKAFAKPGELSSFFTRLARKEYKELSSLTDRMQNIAINTNSRHLGSTEALLSSQKAFLEFCSTPYKLAAGMTAEMTASYFFMQREWLSGLNILLESAVNVPKPRSPHLKLVPRKTSFG